MSELAGAKLSMHFVMQHKYIHNCAVTICVITNENPVILHQLSPQLYLGECGPDN